jgi:hypothetical protein
MHQNRNMHPDLAARFAKLEERRHAMVKRVEALPVERQNTPADPKSFSPAETIMHMALAEEHDLVQMRKRPPSDFAARKRRTSFIYRFALGALRNVKRSPTMKDMVPTPGARLADGVKRWEEVRVEMAKFLEQAPSPDAAFCKLFPFGILSASDLLDLLEAHTHYHETILPA